MLAELHYPASLSGEHLDSYLEDGWFRMGLSIFTTNFLRFNGDFYSAIWLRINLNEEYQPKAFYKIAKLNAKFRVEITEGSIKPMHELLFAKYKKHITFDASPSLTHLLYSDGVKNIYDTYEVNIYDDENLIAAGFFDLGKNSAQGITCFYDPDYKKYSLGKYLMFLKMDFCRRNGFTFFYPGYFAPGYPLFDYKIELAKAGLEYFDLSNEIWSNIDSFVPTETPLIVMKRKLMELSLMLQANSFEHSFWYYEFFDADLIANLNGLNFFDFPVFIYCFEPQETDVVIPIIVYDVKDNKFHLLLCSCVYRIDSEASDSQHYTKNLLRLKDYLFSTESVATMNLIITTSLVKAQ
jgi:arginine-tRNA-protein transferase